MANDMEINEKQTTVDGVRAIELRYRAIRQTDTDNLSFYQSTMRFNSPNMGTLMPDRFLSVLDTTDQCISVFKLALVQLLQASTKFTERGVEFDWISLYMPVRLLQNKDCVSIVTEIFEKFKVPYHRVCFEVPTFLLDKRDDACRESMKKLRSMGCHFMISGAGGEGFPIMKLADYDVDFVMLDRCIIDMLDRDERADLCVKSIISFINELGAEPVAVGVTNARQAFKLYEFECSYYTGEQAGNFMLERFVRRKNGE